MNDFGTFTKIAQQCERFGQNNFVTGFEWLSKVQKSHNLVTLDLVDPLDEYFFMINRNWVNLARSNRKVFQLNQLGGF